MFKVLTLFLLVLSSAQIFASEPSVTPEEECISEREQQLDQIVFEGTVEGTEEELLEEDKWILDFYSLDWKDPGTYELDQSNSTISLTEGYKLLIGEEARKERKLIERDDQETSYVEAVIYDDNFENVIIFENFKTGYISLDDWSEIDPASLLESISENTEKANRERKKNGDNSELHVMDWIQEPILDKQTNTVYWSFEIDNGEEENIVNSVAIRLGRNGFEKIIWVTQKPSYVPFGGHLDVMLRSHSFDPGFQYKDYKIGDQIAGYGITALVAATVGGKIVKAGGVLILLKKFGVFIFAAITALFYKLKNIFFGRNRKD